jgi:YVTN family beta-propeller protein
MKLRHHPFLVIPASIAAVAVTGGLAPAALASPARSGSPAGASGPHVVATIAVGSSPEGVAVDRLTGRVYVVNNAGGSVSVINGSTNKVLATISGFHGPTAVGVDPRTGRVYANGYGSNGRETAVISERTDKVIANIGACCGPIAVNPRTDTIYEATAVINGQTNKVVATITDPFTITGEAVDPQTNRIFVSEGDQDSVAMISGYTNKVLVRTQLGDFETTDVAVDPRADLTYVPILNQLVYVISGKTGKGVGIMGAGTGANGVAVNPRADLIYVANPYDNTVTVDNGQNEQTTATVPVGNFPFKVAANPATGNVYVTDQQDNTVSVIAP